MSAANFCAECGERLPRKGWRLWLRSRFCQHCAQRLGAFMAFRTAFAFGFITVAAFSFGRYLRPSPPPLIIQRLANSPVSDLPVNFDQNQPAARNATTKPTDAAAQPTSDETVYICGARTMKGTPCHRRVHAAGERCFQHKGMPAILPLEKLVIKPDNSLNTSNR